MIHPLISVIIPVLNEEKIMAAILAQFRGLAEIEVIVSDGGSNDATAAICRSFDCRLVTGPPGRGCQLNAGAAAASGDLLWFLHADSQINAELISQVGQMADGNGCWGGCSLVFDHPAFIFRMIAWGSGIRARKGGILFGDQGIFCSRGLFFRQGGFPDLPLMEDWLFSRQMKKIGRPVILPGKIVTSSRRFVQGGPLKTLLKMQLVKLLFCLGVPPARLAEIYRGDRK